MTKSRVIFLVASISPLLQLVTALYFIIDASEPRCFLVDLPENTQVRAAYEALDAAEDLKAVMIIQRREETKDVEVKKETLERQGSVPFTADESGWYEVCLSTIPVQGKDAKDTSMQMSLRINVGASIQEYKGLAKKRNFDELQLELLKLKDRVVAIQKSQDYAETKESRYEDALLEASDKLVYMSLVQISVLIFTGAYQAKYLKAYFHKKKLV